MRSHIFWGMVIFILIASNAFFGLRYLAAAKELESAQIVASSQRYNERAINFMKMFIKRVIKSDKEVDFETRLQLENAVRQLNDPQILLVWQNFVNSQNEIDAQKNVKDLLEVLVEKVYIK